MKHKSILKIANISSDSGNKTAKQPNRTTPEPLTNAKPQNQKPETKERYSAYNKYTPEEFTKKVDQYFKDGGTVREVIVGNGANKQVKNITIYTLTGLTLYLGFNDKKDLFSLERDIRYREPIKRARTMVEKIYEENLQRTGNSANIFALKNFGWYDRQEIITEDKRLKLDI